jgi:hypothetical protein
VSPPSKKQSRTSKTKTAHARRAAQAVKPEKVDEAAFTESLIVTGQAAELDSCGKLPSGATHKIVSGKDDKAKVVRRRFSIV